MARVNKHDRWASKYATTIKIANVHMTPEYDDNELLDNL